MTRRGAATGIVALVLAAGPVLSGCGAAENHALDPEGAVYVALGDSYTAGAGIEPFADSRCLRSQRDYPSLVAENLHVAAFIDRSCAGASTSDLEQPQQFRTTHLNDPQLDAVDGSTTLVTIGMGLNDYGISTGLLLTCLIPAGGRPSPTCAKYLAWPESTIDTLMRTAAGAVADAIRTVAARAPRARIVLVGYPRLAPDGGTCPDRLPVPTAMVARLRDAMAVANRAWAAAAMQTGAAYVDMWTPSEGHDICSRDPWVSDVNGVKGESSPLHPFEAYHEAVATGILRVLGKK